MRALPARTEVVEFQRLGRNVHGPDEELQNTTPGCGRAEIPAHCLKCDSGDQDVRCSCTQSLENRFIEFAKLHFDDL